MVTVKIKYKEKRGRRKYIEKAGEPVIVVITQLFYYAPVSLLLLL